MSTPKKKRKAPAIPMTIEDAAKVTDALRREGSKLIPPGEPTPPAIPPNVLDWAYIGRYAFKREDVEDEMGRDGNAAYDAAVEAAEIAESMRESLEGVNDTGAEAHQTATHLEACALRLSAIAARIMRHAGRLEGFHSSLANANTGYAQLAAHRAGRLPGFTNWPAVDTSEGEHQ